MVATSGSDTVSEARDIDGRVSVSSSNVSFLRWVFLIPKSSSVGSERMSDSWCKGDSAFPRGQTKP